MHVREALERVVTMMRQSEWNDALTVLHVLLNKKMEDPLVMFLMGTCHRMLDQNGLAYSLFLRAMEIQPDNVDAMVNLSAIMRDLGKHKDDVQLLKDANAIRPNNVAILHNLAGAYLQNGTPLKAEKFIDKCFEIEGETPDGLIQRGICFLEQERFGEGFDAWDKALAQGERKTRNFWALGETPMWDGTPGQNVMVYGEQGHGDEIMAAGCLKEVIAISKQVFIDTSKTDLVPLYEHSFPEAIVFCTPDSQLKPYHTELQIDACIPFLSLPTIFRRNVKDFPAHDGYIVAEPARKREMRRRLDELGDGLKIGIVWRGGVKSTHSAYRTIPLEQWAPILKQEGAHFISINHATDAGGEVMVQEETTGVRIHHWQAANSDFAMLTALIDELDLVISVPQTVVHVRAALGKECWVLTANKPPWTFGLKRKDNVWYPKQVTQFRQRYEHDNWDETIMRCAQALSERTGSSPGEKITVRAAEEIKLTRGVIPTPISDGMVQNIC